MNNEVWGSKIRLGVGIIGIKVSRGDRQCGLRGKGTRYQLNQRRNLVKSNKVCLFGD